MQPARAMVLTACAMAQQGAARAFSMAWPVEVAATSSCSTRESPPRRSARKTRNAAMASAMPLAIATGPVPRPSGASVI